MCLGNRTSARLLVNELHHSVVYTKGPEKRIARPPSCRCDPAVIKRAQIAADIPHSCRGVRALTVAEAGGDWRRALANANAPCPSVGGPGKPPSLPGRPVM